jgi:hypothetical protein
MPKLKNVYFVDLVFQIYLQLFGAVFQWVVFYYTGLSSETILPPLLAKPEGRLFYIAVSIGGKLSSLFLRCDLVMIET